MTARMITLENADFIRKINFSTDLNAVADLIEMCFPISSDPDGQAYVQQMRKTAQDYENMKRRGGLGRFDMTRSSGFVWVEKGEIIGNLSMIPCLQDNRRVTLIANVVVHPDQRGRGIGKALTVYALKYLKQRGDHKAWLQVKEDNHSAIHLYRSVGFEEQAVRNTWRIKPFEVNRSAADRFRPIRLRRRTPSEWKDQQAWLMETYPLHLRWNLPVNFSRFAPGCTQAITNFLDGYPHRHWVVSGETQSLGVITWQKTTTYADNLWLAFSEPQEELYLRNALIGVLKRLSRRHPVSIDYARGRSEQVFEDLGFENFRTLVWMSCQI